MPKSQFIDPKVVRKSGKINFDAIPVNQYKTPFTDEVKSLGKENMLRIYRDMVIIREFESMLNQIKTTSEYSGVQRSACLR